MITTYSLLGLMLLAGSLYACLIHQRRTPLPQEVLAERLQDDL